MAGNEIIHRNFKIDAQDGDRKIDEIVKDIKCFREIVKSEEIKDPTVWRGYSEFLYHKYLLECICSECDHNLKSEDVEQLLNGDFQKLENVKCGTERLGKMIQNLHEKTQEMFPIFNAFPTSIEIIDVNFVKEIHMGIGRDTISNAGEFRGGLVIPQGEHYVYIDSDLIGRELEELLQSCRQSFPSLLDAVKFVACFLERFLKIHPFSDGNGRTARLLVNHLLAPFTIIPMTLYTSEKGRQEYLRCIREAHGNKECGQDVGCLERFILEAIHKEYTDMGVPDCETKE